MTSDLHVTKCEPGVAYGAYDLRNRGLDLQFEVTCWPSSHNKHFTLSTGGRAPLQSQPMRFEEYVFCGAGFYETYGTKLTNKGERVERGPSEAEWTLWLNEWREKRSEAKKRERELCRKFREMGEQRRIPYQRIAVVNELAAFYE